MDLHLRLRSMMKGQPFCGSGDASRVGGLIEGGNYV